MKRQYLLILLFGSILSLAACRNQPLVDIALAPLKAPGDATFEQITDAIKRAGKFRGWEMTEKAPGVVTGKLTVRNKHHAVVDIVYDTKYFSIFYVSSDNLNYRMRDGVQRIHPSYLKWTKFLRQDIQRYAGQL